MTTIPTNPAVLKANGILIENYINEFFYQYLPGYTYFYTSKYRGEELNRKVGGVEDSTHRWNLGRDWIILDSEGEKIPEEKARELWPIFEKNWNSNGYIDFTGSTIGGSGYHIHGNLSRDVSTPASWVGGAIALAGIAYLFKKFILDKGGLKG